jgi:endonuclease VIII
VPEGDTIFRSARALNRALAGKVVTGFETGYAHLASVDDDKRVIGRTIESVEARGKWLLMNFSGDLILLTHMRMNGSWHLYRTGERWRRSRRDMRILIETSDWNAVGFAVPVAEFQLSSSLLRKPIIPAPRTDLLKQDFDMAGAITAMREHAKDEVAELLLNQRVIAGIGNVYKSEICFMCNVNPFRLVETLDPSQLELLVLTARKFLALNVAEYANGQISTYIGLRRTTQTSDHTARLWVYGRAGEPCRRCGTPVKMRKQGTGARTSFWCPVCQPMV